MIKAILDFPAIKELKSFLGAIQFVAKFLPKIPERTDRMRKLSRKETEGKWTEREEEFNKKRIKNGNRNTMSSTFC